VELQCGGDVSDVIKYVIRWGQPAKDGGGSLSTLFMLVQSVGFSAQLTEWQSSGLWLIVDFSSFFSWKLTGVN